LIDDAELSGKGYQGACTT